MARLEFDDFFEKEMERVYIAGRVNEAEGVEDALTEHGIDYAVAIEPFVTRSLGLFTSTYSGAAFYVASGEASAARSVLLAAGLSQGLTEDDAA
jgi:hypothetical protein